MSERDTRQINYRRRATLVCYALVAVPMALLAVFVYLPVFWAFSKSLFEFEIGGSARFVGLGHYVEYLTQDPTTYPSLANMLFVTFFAVLTRLTLPLVVAKLIYSLPVLAVGSALFERPVLLDLNPTVLAALFYQSVVVAFVSYLVWFWMIQRYPVSRLAAFTFMAPLFGVILGGLILDEPVTALVWLGLAGVAGGVYVVNR